MLVSAKESYEIVREAVVGFFADDAMSHSAAMAFFAVTALSPVLLIVVAIAGLVFGHDAAQVALSAQMSGLMGPQSAELMETALRSAQDTSSGVMVAAVGVVTLLVTASGVFGEMQSTLNKIWKVEPLPVSLSTLVRARAASLGLVAALGFLLLVSLAATAAISLLGDFITAHLPLGAMILQAINTVVSLALITLLFAAIYKVLPDRTLQWRDVMFGAFVTALLFTIGKTLIGLYLGSSNVASSYGAAGGLLIILLWLFYSSIIFLLGAELTRAYSIRHGSRHDLRAELGRPHVAAAAIKAPDLAVPDNDLPVVRTRRFPGMPDSAIIAWLAAVALFSACLIMFRKRR
ncbi:YihY/virulence factor BrkB family protein [Mesorhizobium sp. ES1-1]|uniref:YihY/virulence factor BrkB family protein n=1 Tax=Mesorhizobium sp. ES1-1 TaxID=2876629 RepID=UPI001CCC69C7|nr:YihY/virulence factor BrkB family protein [Mesorhizobium sp. ES1-1]MBZ9676275.1 YihY/virulence factor BrkB family protein [Mesorhizobium sp. ES1-1]